MSNCERLDVFHLHIATLNANRQVHVDSSALPELNPCLICNFLMHFFAIIPSFPALLFLHLNHLWFSLIGSCQIY